MAISKYNFYSIMLKISTKEIDLLCDKQFDSIQK